MEKNSTVVKSKSSNSAIITKVDKKNTKCLSNYDIITNSTKRRGVYVEKSPNREDVQKPPKRSRPGKKKFLASVLTILSKSTAATQYPEKDNSDRIKERLKPRSTQKSDSNKHKKKYKSRVLNTYKDDSIIVLKSKKDIQQTPSTSSRNDNYKVSYTPQNKKSNQRSIRYVLDNNIYSGVAEGPAKDVLKIDSRKQMSVYEPKETNVEKQVDKKIYNFFVELLETTFDMYNDKELNDNVKESKTGLELNESVLQKLIIHGQSQVDNKKSYNDIDSEKYKFLSSFYERTLNNNLPETPKARPKTKYLINTKKDKTEKLNSFYVPKKSRKSKRALLDILKEELTKDACKPTYEEPGNLYQALKVMVRNKKKSRISTRYRHMEGFSDKDCMLRRKVLFKSNKRCRKSDQKDKIVSRSFQIDTNRFPSRHSLEVYGYDYEKPVKVQRAVETKHTGVPLAPSSSNVDSDDYSSSFHFPISPTTHYTTYND
ncbi:transcriptional regulator ATRX homolog [Danaus plexippus]|uniref:transcriptional regulator ATRX homolog n=1 Tax=Danaus plexippus TaxID=13037 RepID=UPI002AB042E9|nr:transcriptional regulator ATRX homolog [Danaus plexippus]